ncbi:PAS-domain containing protein [Marinobacter sp. F3R08]|uniref:PAS-domain containing protein n=1 Tax=Marinobacter sp. F3R08 TaxID=2841559 RepID=UPI001C0934E9|nr:PAS-domain containing protein [Marinobacter sp. F3R08]MBU2955906.1 PAS-domain containing protein [Marinobacter sp. F3R08]
MSEAALPANEAERLKALADTRLMNSAPEARFNRIVSMARELFDVPIVLITLVDEDHQWFKAKIGTFETTAPRCTSFCAHTFEDDTPLVVEDASKDNRFRDNPMVAGDFGLRFYAGYPIHSQDGFPLGALCLIDHQPRRFGTRELAALRTLVTMVEEEIRATRPPANDPLLCPGSRWGKCLQQAGSALSKKSVALVLSAITFFSLLCVSGHHFLQDLESRHLEMEAAKSETLFNIRGRLETELNARLHLTYGLAGFVRAGPDSINNERFQAFASDLGRSLTGVRSLQLAPEGVVTYLWPEATNSPAMGHDLLTDPARREAAMKAIESRRLWVAGPHELLQGGVALIGRAPIFVTGNSASGDVQPEVFWGFATVLVDLPDLLEESGLNELPNGTIIAIRGRNGLGENGETFKGTEAVFNGPHLSAEVALPAGSWNIGIKTSEKPGLRDIALQKYVFGFALATLVAMLLYGLLRLPFRFQQAVDNAKEDLSESNARFKDAIESLPDGFAVFDSNDRLVRCNEKYREFFQVRNQPVPLGVPFSELVKEGLESGVYRLLDDSQTAQEAFLHQRLDHHRHPRQEGMEMELSCGRWIRTIESRVPSGGTVISYSDISDVENQGV